METATAAQFTPRYQLWLDLGQPDDLYSLWSAKMWREYELETFGAPLDCFEHALHVCECNADNDRLTRWLLQRYKS
jgi:hypothetical protein